MTELAVETTHLSKAYARRKAVRELNIQVPRGRVYGFIGPNGAGKTTTMRMFATLLRPTTGRALILSHDLSQVAQIRARIGYLPEKTALYERLTVREYLRVFAHAYGVTAKGIPRLLEDVLSLVDLNKMDFRIISTLSKGMKQRVALARCLIHNPDLLLLDEPNSGLDPRGRLEMRELLKELRRLGKTIFISSHVLTELDEICDSVGIIEKGDLLFSGSIAELKQRIGATPHFLVRAEPEVCLRAGTNLPGIEVVEQEDGTAVFRVTGQASQADVAAEIIRNGGKVLELAEQKANLEKLFIEFTEGGGVA